MYTITDLDLFMLEGYIFKCSAQDTSLNAHLKENMN